MPANKKHYEKINLTLIDNSSSTCIELERYLNARIGQLRKDNDDISLDASKTMAIRVEIKMIDELLKKLNPRNPNLKTVTMNESH
jgi:hypothetical protein